MLSPKYLEALPQPIIKIYSEFENELLGDIAKRITKADYLTPTAEWRLYKAEQLRLSSREITQRLARLTGRSEKEIRQLYTGALKEALRNDEKIYRAAIKAGCLSEDAEHKLDSYFGSIAFSNALKAGYRNTNGLMRNLCNSAAAQANSRLSDELDKAFLKVASGAYTADEAVYSAVQDLGRSGIKVINYSSGHKDKVDVAVRRAVITGIGQAAGNMQLSLAADMGCDLVEVTAHLGARPSHAVWQGHIYSLSGKDPKYPDFRSSTGYGTGAGLCGWNCRHSFYPYFEGLSKPNGVPFTREENDEVYRNTQKQRAYERAIRQSKRELAALDGARSAADSEELRAKLDREFSRKAVTLKRREARLAEHLRASGLLPDNSRVRVNGFGRSVSGKAVWAAKKAAAPSAMASSSGGNDIKELINIFRGRFQAVDYSELPESFRTRIETALKSSDKDVAEAVKRTLVGTKIRQVTGNSYYYKFIDYIDINTAASPAEIAHEVFHRIDYLHKITKSGGLLEKALKKDFEELQFISGGDIIGYIKARFPNAFYFNAKGKQRIDKKYLGVSDILSGLTNDDVNLGFHHSKKYWFANKSRCISEAWANFGHIYFGNNTEVISMFEELFPTFAYNAKYELRRLIK